MDVDLPMEPENEEAKPEEPTVEQEEVKPIEDPKEEPQPLTTEPTTEPQRHLTPTPIAPTAHSTPSVAPTENSSAESFLPRGTLVAVLCRVDSDSEEDEWMLATILEATGAGAYEVEDCELIEGDDEEAQAVQAANGLGKRRSAELARILRMPTSGANMEELKPKANVLALFPGTTCLYPAQVISPPSRRKKTRDYLLRFSDDEEPSRTCPPQFVIPAPSMLAIA